MARPGFTALALALLIGIWAIVKGFTEIAMAIRLRKEIQGEFFMILMGLIAVLFGLFLVFRPGEGALAVVKIIAIFVIIEGILAILLGFKLKGLKGAEGA